MVVLKFARFIFDFGRGHHTIWRKYPKGVRAKKSCLWRFRKTYREIVMLLIEPADNP
jgi:hypothetical protein